MHLPQLISPYYPLLDLSLSALCKSCGSSDENRETWCYGVNCVLSKIQMLKPQPMM